MLQTSGKADGSVVGCLAPRYGWLASWLAKQTGKPAERPSSHPAGRRAVLHESPVHFMRPVHIKLRPVHDQRHFPSRLKPVTTKSRLFVRQQLQTGDTVSL